MRLATWNIKGAQRRRGRLLDWLRARKPDLVALQKVNVEEGHFPSNELADEGYHAAVHSFRPTWGGDFGVAILSRRKPSVVRKGLPGQEILGTRLLTVEVDGLEFSSVYAPFKLEYAGGTKIEWFDCLTEHLTTRRSMAVRRVLCGDLNVVPECRYGPRRRIGSPNYDKDVQAIFSGMLNAAGLSDLYTAPPSHPKGWLDRFTFQGNEACLKLSRVEYVLGTHGMTELNPVVWFDIDHAIARNPPFYWVRSPIIADFDN